MYSTYSSHRNENIVILMNFLSLAAMEVVIVTTSGTTNYENIIKHYSDVIMSVISSQITGVSSVCSTVCLGADRRKHHKALRQWSLWGKPPVTGGFPSQRASNAENVAIWWRHYELQHFPFIILTPYHHCKTIAHTNSGDDYNDDDNENDDDEVALTLVQFDL